MIELWLVVSTMCFPAINPSYVEPREFYHHGKHVITGMGDDDKQMIEKCTEIVQLSTSTPAQGVRAYRVMAIDDDLLSQPRYLNIRGEGYSGEGIRTPQRFDGNNFFKREKKK